MLPIYFVIGLLNIFSQHHNYGIDIKDPDFDIRVRRSINEDAKQQVFNYNDETNLNREKRYAYNEKPRITNNDVPVYNNENNNNGSRSTRNNGNRYNIFNPNWNFLFNTTKNRNGVNSRASNNRLVINSYPYGYPAGYGPKTHSAAASDRITTTTGFRNQDSNTPYFYNYQNPDGRNFAGFVGYASNISGQGVTPVPYGSRYSPRANNNNNNAWNNALAPYPPSNTQKPLSNIFTNNLPASYSTTNNSGIHYLPYATNPVNGIYNNFNSIPKPFVKNNLSSYAPNFNNGSANLNNGTLNFDNGSANFNNGSASLNNGTLNFNNGSANFNNGSYAPVNNTNTTVTTTEKIVSGCVICNIPCPQFMRRFGRFCMPENDDDY